MTKANTDEELSFTEWEGVDDKFALRIQGDAMIDERIVDGDFVVIQKSKTPKEGDIVAIRDDDGEATLRVFHPLDRGGVRLSPANKRFAPILRDRASLEILGVLVGVVRKY